MSNLGLYSGWYAQLRNYSELLDAVLLHASSSAAGNVETERQQLSRLFLELAGAPHPDPKTTALRIWIGRNVKMPPEQWRGLAEAVLRGQPGATVVRRLEELARHLDLHRAEILYDMRGR